jgi:2-methylcitrate dehydratase PrpD
VATLLIEGDVFVDQFNPASVSDRARIELARKVEVVHDPAITALGSAFRHKVQVDIHFCDGMVETETREAPRGSEQSFATRGEIVEKFRKLTRGAITEARQEALVDAVLALETAPQSRRVADLLRAQ